MTPNTEIEPRAAAQIQPHERVLVERARKLEALPLADLVARVAEGLAQLRLSFGLEAHDADPVRALFAALPRTELARRSTDLALELEAARVAVLERERAAAEVDRRSESLKEALRDRSTDLAAALGRAGELAGARSELEVARGELELARSELETARARIADVERERAALHADLAQALDTARAVAGELESVRHATTSAARVAASELETARIAAIDAAARHELELAAERAERAEPDPRLEIARSALDAAAGRELARARLAELERGAAIERAEVVEAELQHLRRERDTTVDELRRLQSELESQMALHRAASDRGERALAEQSRAAELARRELEWRRREMDALREASTGMRWKLLGGDAVERIARWNREGTP